MKRTGKLLPVGVVVTVTGLLTLGAGVAGMVTIWPIPGWSTTALTVGTTLMIPGVFLLVLGQINRSMSTFMSDFNGATQPGGKGGGLFGMINDLAGGNQDLLVSGVPASAVILSMRDTGVTVNDLPVVGFELEVRREDGEVYRVAHRETMPRLLVGAILPGAHVPVRLDPANPSRLAVDWRYAAGYASPSAGQRVSAADILARGVPATATVLGTFSTDGMTADNGDPIVGFVLRVTGPQGPYEVRLAHRVPPQHLARVLPGTVLPAKIAPEDSQKVAIDWEQHPPLHTATGMG
ncbi:hypothetical protein [Nonomuraea sp. SYSU D8015]|uniref:hypothetical protein n=1 Tax=Nonomuraea sp. SYSU D8015 TaxID=2593644 RepID=UPI001661734A|nr:hypothetical protein [Nonomuraea sp. SYSU D8015]